MNKKIIIGISVIILVVLLSLVTYFYQNEREDIDINKESLSMVEEYLNNKYNMELKLKDYDYYDHGDLGINAGEHYIFNFKPIEGLELYANLDYISLEKENLNYLRLNITDIDKANKLRKYIEENGGLNCKVTEYRLVEHESYGKYYCFRIELDNNSNDWIMGNIYVEENLENAKELNISNSLREKINLKNDNDISLIKILNIIKQN